MQILCNEELNENAERSNTRSVANKSAPSTSNGPCKGPGGIKKAKGQRHVKQKIRQYQVNSSQIFYMLQEHLKRSENTEAGTSGYNTCKNKDTTEDCIAVDHETYIDQQDLFPEVIFDENNDKFAMPKIFEDETKFCSPVSEKLATIIKI
jgi:hypothetical protein